MSALINSIGLLWGVFFAASFYIPYKTPRFLVFLAARVPHNYRSLALSFFRVVFHVFVLLFFLWLVLFVLTLLIEYFQWPL